VLVLRESLTRLRNQDAFAVTVARLFRKLLPRGLWCCNGFGGSPKEELLKSISSPLGNGVPFPRSEDPFRHRIRGDKKGSTFIPIEKPTEQSRRYCDYARSGGETVCAYVQVPARWLHRIDTTLPHCLQLPTAYGAPDYRRVT